MPIIFFYTRLCCLFVLCSLHKKEDMRSKIYCGYYSAQKLSSQSNFTLKTSECKHQRKTATPCSANLIKIWFDEKKTIRVSIDSSYRDVFKLIRSFLKWY